MARIPSRPFAAAARCPLDGVRILVVEDSPDNQAVVSQLLRRHGANVDLAIDGREAIDRALVRAYDVILMDLQMPRMSGLEATRALQTVRPEVRVVLLTGSLSADAAREALALGVVAIVLANVVAFFLVRSIARRLEV